MDHIISQKKPRYSVSRKKSTEIFYCLQCNTVNDKKSNTTNKFCNNTCFVEYRWHNSTLPNLISGNGSCKSLKKYLINEFGLKCSICGILQWNNKPISFHLDHIDGNSDNNHISNGRILCPNCHSQTETYCGKNTKNTKRNSYLQAYKAVNKQKRR